MLINIPKCNYNNHNNNKRNQVFFHKYDFGIFLYCLCPVMLVFFCPSLSLVLVSIYSICVSIVCLFLNAFSLYTKKKFIIVQITIKFKLFQLQAHTYKQKKKTHVHTTRVDLFIHRLFFATFFVGIACHLYFYCLACDDGTHVTYI